jgi:acetyl-CoA synthetase
MLEKFLINDERYSSYEEFKSKFRIRIPDNFNFSYDVVDEIASQTPEKVALVWCNEEGEEARFTFRELKTYSDKAANFFQSAGIRKGDAVMLVLKRRYEFWFCILALHKIGAVCIPATHLLTTKDIVYRNNAASIKAIVAVMEPELVQDIEQSQGASPTLALKILVGGQRDGWYDFHRELAEASEGFRRPTGAAATANKDISILYFTSGTTGMPKMVMHDFTYPLGHIVTAKYWQNVQDGGLHLTVADTGWAKAAWGKIYGQWICGSAVFVYDFDEFKPKDMLETIIKHGVTTFCAPPTIYRFLIKEDLSGYDFGKLKYCAVAGEPLNPEVFYQFMKITGIKLMEGYGQSETTLAIGTFSFLEPKPGSIGKPVPGYDIDLLDELGNSCGPFKEGQIVIRTDHTKPAGMFGGYYRDENMTRSVWKDGTYYTRDVAYRDEDGYYWFVGRDDDVIKSSGYRIGPFEVESALMSHPSVLECAVTGSPDPDRGQVVKATVVLSSGYSPSNELMKELQNHVKKTTAPYKYPRIIEFVDELPKTISGKIRRVALREKDRNS